MGLAHGPVPWKKTFKPVGQQHPSHPSHPGHSHSSLHGDNFVKHDLRRCSWWNWCFPRVHLSLGQFLGISWILTKSNLQKTAIACSIQRCFCVRPSSHLEPSSLRRASLFYTANLGTPKNGPDAICRLVLYLPLCRFSSSACSWAFPDVDVYRSQGRWVMSHLRILRMVILIFPSLMGSSHPFPNAIPGPFQSEHRLALRDGMLLLSSVDSDLGDPDRRIMKSWRI